MPDGISDLLPSTSRQLERSSCIARRTPSAPNANTSLTAFLYLIHFDFQAKNVLFGSVNFCFPLIFVFRIHKPDVILRSERAMISRLLGETFTYACTFSPHLNRNRYIRGTNTRYRLPRRLPPKLPKIIQTQTQIFLVFSSYTGTPSPQLAPAFIIFNHSYLYTITMCSLYTFSKENTW